MLRAALHLDVILTGFMRPDDASDYNGQCCCT